MSTCSNLPTRDGVTRPDPMCITSIRWFNNNALEEKHKTEVVGDNMNPSFTQRPIVPYTFEQKQIVVFKLFDANLKKVQVRDTNLGYAECSLGELVTRGKVSMDLNFGFTEHMKNIVAIAAASKNFRPFPSGFWGRSEPVLYCNHLSFFVLLSVS